MRWMSIRPVDSGFWMKVHQFSIFWRVIRVLSLLDHPGFMIQCPFDDYFVSRVMQQHPGEVWVIYGRFRKIGIPQNGWFIMETLLKWMIWGYHYFRKHPYELCETQFHSICVSRLGCLPKGATRNDSTARHVFFTAMWSSKSAIWGKVWWLENDCKTETSEQRFLVGRFSLYKVCLVKCWRRHFACARRLFVGILRMLVIYFFLRRRCWRKCFVVILQVVFCCCDMRRGAQKYKKHNLNWQHSRPPRRQNMKN